MSRDYKFHNHRTGQYAEGLSYDKNGNIASIAWRTKTDNITRGYGYDYDHLNRLNYASNLKALGGPSFFVNLGRDGQYAEDLTYDKNGNITTLKRYGQEELGQPIEIDDLTYTYTANQLQTVTDATNNAEGFSDVNKTGADYVYDSFGNMITDKNKSITAISYNHLNLPYKVTFANGGNISFVYDAAGIRLSKKVQPSGGVLVTTDYIGGFQYENNVLKFFKQAEGFVEYKNNQYIYNYIYKDHLGNNRLVYADLDGNGVIDPATEIIEENNYYPFGLKHKGYNELSTENPAGHKYKFQGQEHQDELGLNWDSFKWRNYMPDIGRFFNIDPLSEKYAYQSHYNFAENKVIDHVELEGLEGLHHTLANKDGTKSHIIQKNVILLRQKPQTIPEGSTQRQRKRIERRNKDIASEERGRFNQIKNELNNTYGGIHKNTNGETVTFEINFKEVYVDNPKADMKGEFTEGLTKLQFSYLEGLTGKDNKVAPAAVFTSKTEHTSHGSTHANFVSKNNPSAPYGTYSHEFIHTLAVPDNGYNKGGVLGSPPQSLTPQEVDEIINRSVPSE